MSKRKQRKIPKRRLPAPKMPPDVPGSPYPLSAAPAEPHPVAAEIAAQLRTVCQVAHLEPFRVFSDWVGMVEASLRLLADNAKALALTGRFSEDPPPVKAIFKRARQRYLRATEQYPSAYRRMQEAFATSFALLTESAGAGLGPAVNHRGLNPNVIGQAFLVAVQPGRKWRVYFSDWAPALAAARKAIPDGAGRIADVLVAAALRARQAGQQVPELEPGHNWPAWLGAIAPHLEPLLIHPEGVDAGTSLLAAAAQFPPWAVQDGRLVRFLWRTDIDPLLTRLVSINVRLYGLNGSYMEQMVALGEVIHHLEQAGETDPSPATEERPPLVTRLQEESPALFTSPPGTTAARRADPGLSFQERFAGGDGCI